MEPRDQARLLRLAAVRGRQLGRQQLLPLHVPERPVRHALRLRGGGDPQRVAEQHRPDRAPRPGRRRRRLAQAHGRPSRRASRSRPAAARRSRSPGRSTTTTRPTRRTPSGRPTTTAPGSCSTAPRTGGARRAYATTASACCASTACSARASSARPATRIPIPVKFGPDGSLYMATWGHDCCRAQLPASQPGRLMRIDFIGDQVDTTAPVVDAGPDAARRTAPATTSAARRSRSTRPTAPASRASSTRSTARSGPATRSPSRFTTRGTYTVRVPRHGPARTTPPTLQQVTFTVVAGAACLPALSDEFNGALDTERWSYRHPTTPATGDERPERRRRQPRAAARRLLARPHARRARSGSSPSRCPTGDFTLVAKISAPGLDADVGRPGQHVRPGRPEDLPDQRQLDQGRAHPQRGRQPDGLGEHVLRAQLRDQRHAHARHPHGPRGHEPADLVDADRPHRRHDHRRLLAQRSRGAGANWVALGTANIDTVMPAAAGPRYIGVYGGNGSIYGPLRLRPVHAGLAESTRAAPVSTHTRRRRPDGAGGWYRTPVRRDAGGRRRRRVRLGRRPHASTASAAARSRRTAAPIRVAADGQHTVEYRSTDKAGNAETAKSVAVKLDATAPATTATTDPPGPGRHRARSR